MGRRLMQLYVCLVVAYVTYLMGVALVHTVCQCLR